MARVSAHHESTRGVSERSAAQEWRTRSGTESPLSVEDGHGTMARRTACAHLMTTFGWLHISDLHATVRRAAWSSPQTRDQLFRDLVGIHRDTGDWDLVLVSGDLTLRGAPEEFERADEVLAELCEHLRSLGPDPCVLVVPGNHDICRPADPPPSALRALRRWHDDPRTRDEFWNDPESPARRVVDRALEPFAQWWGARGFPERAGVHRGVLPGDFTATIEKQGVRLGVVGLCSAFLQLTGDVYEERAALDPLQLLAATRGDVPGWIAAHDAVVLVTHHPSPWLDARHLTRNEKLDQELIDPPGRFCAHLSGHLHDDGPVVRRGTHIAIRAPSLLGLREWEDPRGGSVKRCHGYNAVRLVIDDTDARLEVRTRLWRDGGIGAGTGASHDRIELASRRFPRPNTAASGRILERAALRDALAAVYPSAAEARRVAERADVALPSGTGGATVDVWHVVVSEAEQQNRLSAVVRIADKEHLEAGAVRGAWDRFQRDPRAGSTDRSARGSAAYQLAGELQEHLAHLEPALLRTVVELASLARWVPLDSSSWQIARAAVYAALQHGPDTLARLAAAIARVSGGPRHLATAQPGLEAIALGDHAVEAGKLPVPAREVESGRAPTPATLVKLLVQMFPDQRDFDGFVLTHFPEIYRRFTNGMSHEARAHTLVDRTDPNEVVARLRRDVPAGFARYQRVLDYRDKDELDPTTTRSRSR
jgi:hypothetical protein